MTELTKAQAEQYVREYIEGVINKAAEQRKRKAEELASSPAAALSVFEWANNIAVTQERALIYTKILKAWDKGTTGILDIIDRAIRDITEGLLEGYDLPTSTSAFSNATMMAKNEAYRQFLKDMRVVMPAVKETLSE